MPDLQAADQMAEPSVLPAPSLALAFRLCVMIGAPLELGHADGLTKRIIPITGGTIEGPRLSGKVLAGGADWQSIHDDGTVDVLARYALQADDGTLISVVNSGLRRGHPEILSRITAGELVDPALYYFRTTPRFGVSSDGPHAWLGRAIFVCTAARYRDYVRLDIFSVE